MQLVVQQNHLRGQILYKSLGPSKKRPQLFLVTFKTFKLKGFPKNVVYLFRFWYIYICIYILYDIDTRMSFYNNL